MMKKKNKSVDPAGRPKFWQRYKIHFAATIFAVLIWFLVVSDGTYDYEVTIPVDRPASQQHLTISGDLPAQARIKVRGQGLALLSLILFRDGQLEIRPDWELGNKTIYPSTDDVRLFGNAKNLTVLQVVEPAEINLHIEPSLRRMVPVRPMVQIRLVAGYTVVGEPVLKPDRVEVHGAESLLAEIDSIDTEPAVFEKRKTSFLTRLMLLPPPESRILVEPDKVELDVTIQKLMEKKITNIPISVINLPAGMRALVMPAKLTLIAEGGVQVVAELSEKDFQAYIDYSRNPQQLTGDFPAYIRPVPWVRFRDIEPKRFKVVLEKE
jgi:hypothetical protein